MLKQCFAPQLVVLYAFVASTLYVHFRGRQRLRFARQIGDHSTYLPPYNVLMYAGWAVPNEPVIPVEKFPELAKLRDNWETIRDEAVRLFDEGFIRAAAKNNDWGFYSFFKSGWKRFYLKWYDDFLPSARSLCPKTVELLNSIPTVHGAMFAKLYEIHLASRKIKAWNRTVYYTLKYSLMVGIVGLIVMYALLSGALNF